MIFTPKPLTSRLNSTVQEDCHSELKLLPRRSLEDALHWESPTNARPEKLEVIFTLVGNGSLLMEETSRGYTARDTEVVHIHAALLLLRIRETSPAGACLVRLRVDEVPITGTIDVRRGQLIFTAGASSCSAGIGKTTNGIGSLEWGVAASYASRSHLILILLYWWCLRATVISDSA